MYKVIVAHPHQQHSFRLATALQREGNLFCYITTVYNKPGSLTSKIIPCLKGVNKIKAEKRRCSDVPDEKVLQFGELLGLLYLLLMRLFKNDKRIMNPYDQLVGRYFGWKVAKYAIKHNVDAVIGYDAECEYMFKILKKYSPKIRRIMDVSAANRLYMKKIYEKDIEITPDFASRLKKERCDLFLSSSQKYMQMLEREICYTQYFLVPSNFVKKSLKYSGVKEEQMLLCPYGVDLGEFDYDHKKNNQGTDDRSPIKAIYVGGVKQLKGISYLLKAFAMIDPNIANLTIVGAGNPNDQDIRPYLSNVKFTGTVAHGEISKLLNQSDVFVFPSLGDGFSLSALEAAASGLPLIISENTGVTDAMTEGKEGFIIPVQSAESIKDKVIWFYKNREQMESMGAAARKMAQRYTWENYYKNVVLLLDDIVG